MTDLKNIEKIRDGHREPLQKLIGEVLDVTNMCTPKLAAVYLYGSAARDDYRPGRSDVNVALIFDQISYVLCKALRVAFKRTSGPLGGLPLTIDRFFLQRSQAVFPLEIFEWRDESVLLWGRDELAALNPDPAGLERQVNENIRSFWLRFHQVYMESGTEHALLGPYLEKSLGALRATLRGWLRMKGREVPRDIPRIVAELQEATGLHLDGVEKLYEIHRGPKRPEYYEMENHIERFMGDLWKMIVVLSGAREGDL